MVAFFEAFRRAWSATGFEREELSAYACISLVNEVRAGVRAMSALIAALVVVAILAHTKLHLDGYYLYAYALVAALSLHIFIAAGQVHEVRGLYLLGMALLVISATALVFVAHRTGAISPLLLGNVLLLFVVIPMVPWGLREASIVTAAIWILLTSSTIGVAARFGADALTLLQMFMFTTALASLAVVGRAVGVRKGELSARHDLEAAREDLTRLSSIDPLTGAWNRRYLETAFRDLGARYNGLASSFYFALFDLDDFKILNDTYGHAAGDRVLQCFSDAVRSRLGDSGHLIRLGGDEFCAVFVTESPDALLAGVVEDARKQVRGLDGMRNAAFDVSLGYASATLNEAIALPALYRRADQNMYDAKPARAGRQPSRVAINFEESGKWMLPQH